LKDQEIQALRNDGASPIEAFTPGVFLKQIKDHQMRKGANKMNNVDIEMQKLISWTVLGNQKQKKFDFLDECNVELEPEVHSIQQYPSISPSPFKSNFIRKVPAKSIINQKKGKNTPPPVFNFENL